MKTFKVAYPNGSVAEINTDDESVEAFCNSHFGSTWEVAQDHGAKVEMLNAPPQEDRSLEQAWGINPPGSPTQAENSAETDPVDQETS